jgi:ribonuclease E
VQTSKISRFGLLELSRQRLAPSLEELSYTPCPRCNGIGHIRGTESSALHILRIIQEEAMKDNIAAVHVQVPVDVATFLLNEKRNDIHRIESRLKVDIVLIPNPHLETPHYSVTRLRQDDLQGDLLQVSYKLVEKPIEHDAAAEAAQEIKAAQRPQAAVQGIVPMQPAPMEQEVKKQKKTTSFFGRLFGWLKAEEEEEAPVKKPSSKSRRERGEGRRGDRRERKEGGKRRGGERGERGERDEAQPRQQQAKSQRNETQRQEQRAEQPRAERPPRQQQQRNNNVEQPAPSVATEQDEGQRESSNGGNRKRNRRGGRRERERREPAANAPEQSVMDLMEPVAPEAAAPEPVTRHEPAPAYEPPPPAPAPATEPIDLSASGLVLIETDRSKAVVTAPEPSEAPAPRRRPRPREIYSEEASEPLQQVETRNS